MSVKRSPQATAAIGRALSGEPWQESSWEARPKQFAKTMLEALRQSLESHQAATSVAAAYTAARGESPLAPSAYHETWARVVLLWASRQIVRAAAEDPAANEESVRQELWRGASEILAASDHLNGYKTTDLGAWPTERIVDSARESLSRLKERIVLDSDGARFLAGYLDQCKHIVSLLAAGKQSVDSLLRGTIVRIDRYARQENLRAWIDAPLATRQAWARRVVLEAAWALSDAIPQEYAGEERAKQACLWLARMACQVASRADRAGEWVPVDKPSELGGAPNPVPLETPTPVIQAPAPAEKQASAPAAPPKEKKMDDKKQAMLKMLEADATDAGWRLAGSQFIKLTREPLVAFLSRQLGENDESMRKKIGDFLDTELGEALVASMLSMGLSMIPQTAAGDIPQRLAKELRIRAMSEAGDVVADLLMGPLRQVATLYLSNVGPAVQAAVPAAIAEPVRAPAEVKEPVTVGASSTNNGQNR